MRFLVWRIRNISDHAFILILAGLIGLIAGFAAVSLKTIVHLMQHLLTADLDIKFAHVLYAVFPLIGILLTVLVAKLLFKEELGHGVTDILYSISRKSSVIKRTKMYSRMITSAITVSFGGSVGLEAPIVVTGSAIGSNVGLLMHMNYRRRTLLIGCGAAGAIAGIFNSPIAGVIFAIEVILVDASIAALIPLLISAVFGSLISLILIGDQVLFSFDNIDVFNTGSVPHYIVLGILCGFVSVYFTRATYLVEAWIQSISKNFLIKAIIGGLLLGLIIFLLPPIYGEGYYTIKILLNGEGGALMYKSMFFEQIDNKVVLLLFFLAIIVLKPLASALTIGSGGSGGVFAPSLFLGGIVGYTFSSTSNYLNLTSSISVPNFTLVGMCGVMSAVLHAPMTAIFLIAEITSGYTLFVPLMLVSAISYTTISYFERYSVYTKHLIERGDLIQGDQDREVLRLININKIIEKDLLVIHPKATLDDLVKLVTKSKRNIFPVVDEHTQLKGIITLDDIREIMFDAETRKSVLIETIMHQPPAILQPFESMEEVMRKFERTGAWNLPVIDQDAYVGFVSKSRIFNTYRTKLRRKTLDM